MGIRGTYIHNRRTQRLDIGQGFLGYFTKWGGTAGGVVRRTELQLEILHASANLQRSFDTSATGYLTTWYCGAPPDKIPFDLVPRCARLIRGR